MYFKCPYCAIFCPPKFYPVLDPKFLLIIILLRNTHNMCSYFHHETKCFTNKWQYNNSFFDVLLTVHLSIFTLVINQFDAQNCCFTISLFHASTCFEHYVLIIRRSKLYYTASGIVTLCRWPFRAQVERGMSQPAHRTATYRCDDTRCCII